MAGGDGVTGRTSVAGGEGAISRTGVDGKGSAGGQGLRGMRERAAMFGGRVEAGWAAGGGFLVSARLPYRVGRP